MSHDLLVALKDIAGDDALAVLNHFLNSNTEQVLEKSELIFECNVNIQVCVDF